LKLPPGDVLLHSGDFTYDGLREEVLEFNDWIGTLDFKHKIVIPGNHELTFDTSNDKQKLLTNCTYLQHDSVIIYDKIKIFGTPYMPIPTCRTAFSAIDSVRKDYFSQIPSDTDILLTHSPPFDIFDTIWSGKQVGDKVLREEIKTRLKLKLHVFGHIHEQNGRVKIDDTTYINAAICDLDYKPDNTIHVFEIKLSEIENKK
jgi:Icc-related predicted phosphoesterase